MKKIIPILIISFLSLTASAQVISKFSWNSNPIMTALVGPNATSVSSFATSSSGAVGGTNGLNPGSGSHNIDLILPGTSFNVNGIAISVDFRREETEASFFTRGASMDFGMNGGKLYVKFLVKDGGTGSVVINSGNIYNIPNDHIFHNYKFKYDYTTGKAELQADGTTVYTNTSTAGRALYWTGAGNVTIGANMDATSNNVAVLDNLLIQNSANMTILPLTLLSFDAAAEGSDVLTQWSTSREQYIASINVERSADALVYTTIGSVIPVNSYNSVNQYEFRDHSPIEPIGYYRIKMTDMDGKYTYSAVQSVSKEITAVNIRCFPNPATDHITISFKSKQAGKLKWSLSTIDGRIIAVKTISIQAGSQQINIELGQSNLHGMLLVLLESKENNLHQSLNVLKQ